MGKKSKNKRKQQNRGAARAGASAASSGAAAAAAASGSMMTLRVDQNGVIAEDQTRYFFAIRNFLASIAVPRIQAGELQWVKSLEWNHSNPSNNKFASWLIVHDYILQNIDVLVTEIEDRKHDHLFKDEFGRPISHKDLECIQALKCHNEDDFFVLKHIPHQGAVFCQMMKRENHSETDEDVYQPRFFMVRGLVDPLKEDLLGLRKIFANEHPRLHAKYGEVFPDFCQVHTTLVPFLGGISTFGLFYGAQKGYHKTPKEMAAAVRFAVEAYRVDPSPSVQWSLNQEDDPIFSLSAAHPSNMQLRPSMHDNGLEDRYSEVATETILIRYTQRIWAPALSAADPAFCKAIGDIAMRRSPPDLKLGGQFKEGESRFFAQLDGLCPFHQSKGEGPVFSECCLQDYQKRLALRKKVPFALVMNPLEFDEGDWALNYRAVHGADKSVDVKNILRVDYMLISVTRYTIDKSDLELLQKKLDEVPYFHNVHESEWFFGSQHAIAIAGHGITSFGKMEIESDKGQFKITTESLGRLKSLSRLVKLTFNSNGIKVLAAELEVFPVSGKKPQTALVNELQTIVVEGLDHLKATDVITTVDTQLKTLKACAYCGLRDDDKLQRCPCKRAWYCCASHQKKHFRIHKSECSAVKAKTSN